MEEDPDKMTSEAIFYQLCLGKPKKASDFLKDYLLYSLKVATPFEDDKYKKTQMFLLDFMVGAQKVFDFNIKFIQNKDLEKENYAKLINDDLSIEDNNLTDFFYQFFVANISNFEMLKNKNIISSNSCEIVNFKTNLMLDFGHTNMNLVDNNFKVLLKLETNTENNVYEIQDKNLLPIINKLKDIYEQIKN